MSKFVIKDAGLTTVYYQLVDNQDEVLIKSKVFDTVKEAKQDIARIKKAITRYTKVEVEVDE